MEHSSTQSSTQRRELLVDAQGAQLKVVVQAVELEGRPKLVRMLKNLGALVVSNAKEASIILVDSTTECGKRLIRTWGHDASKVVLEHTWARASIQAGRPLLEADNWGGAMTIDDGKPVTIDGVVVDEDELEEVEALVTKSPLPTPRVTPVDAASKRLVNERLDVTRSNSIVSSPPTTKWPSPGSPVVQPVVAAANIKEEPTPDTRSSILPAFNPPPPSGTQQSSNRQPTLFMQSSQPQNAYAHAPFVSQPPYPSTQPPTIPTQLSPYSGFPSIQSQIIHAPNTPHTPLPPMQPPMMPMTSNVMSINGVDVDLQGQNFATLMTIVEQVVRQSLVRNQQAVPQPPAIPLPPSSASDSQATVELGPAGVDASSPSSRDYVLNDAGTSSRKYKSSTNISEYRRASPKTRTEHSRSPGELLTESMSRKRPSIVKSSNAPRKRSRKGKGKAPCTDSSEQSEVDERVGTSDSSNSTHSSTRSQKTVACKRQGEIFLSGSAHPLRFFVQVDLHGRHGVVTNIKKNKGKIVNNIADADYVILFARSDTFQGLLNEAIALGKSPILAAFVADCIREGALLDETGYILESATRIKALKPNRHNTSFTDAKTSEKMPREIKVENSATPPPSKTSKTFTAKKTKMKKTPKPARSKPIIKERDSASRSPTPPPESGRRMMSSGKYLFTEEEDEYFLRLAKYYLMRDPAVSNSVLVLKAHKKMSHHSAGSWSVHIEKKLKGALEDIRKRANIASRKHAGETALPPKFVNGSTSSKGEITLSIAEDGDIPLDLSYPSEEELQRQDFEVITQFFASGKGDDDDDERVWQELEKHQKCRTADSWPDYYAAHQEQVFTRIDALVNGRAME